MPPTLQASPRLRPRPDRPPFLFPPLATAQPQREAVRPPAEPATAAPSLFAEIRSLLSILWAETGSGLDPDGGAHSGASSGTRARRGHLRRRLQSVARLYRASSPRSGASPSWAETGSILDPRRSAAR